MGPVRLLGEKGGGRYTLESFAFRGRLDWGPWKRLPGYLP
jgi:hypothetical protein